MSIINYILEQPHILQRVIREIPPQLASIPDLIGSENYFLIGSGTSFNALAAVEPLWAEMISPFVKTGHPLSFISSLKVPSLKSTALILSQTGASKTTIQAVEHAQRLKMRVITLTADPDSPIAQVSSEKIIIPVGPETVGPKTKGYTASILTLLLLILAQRKKFLDISQFLADLPPFLKECSNICKSLTSRLASVNFILIMGQRRHLATALEGSLKLTEMCGLPVAAFDTEEAFHGRFHGLNPQNYAFFITSTAEELELANTGMSVLSELGIPGGILNLCPTKTSFFDLPILWPNSATLPELDLISAIIPFQLSAYYLAKAKNIIPENMKYPGLSQKLQIKTR
jgi:glucosamine 6-phosphate synthetase-like amidotransferase/phosphosugar isomerase protein